MARPEKSKTELGQRLSEARKLLDFAKRVDFAEKLDLPIETLANYERGDRDPPIELLTRYHSQFGIDLTWLLTGNGDHFSEKGQGLEPAATSGDLVFMPHYQVQASAGRGLIAVDQMPIGEVAFGREFLRNLGANPDYCYILEARGDSMWPTIPDGALLIADASKTQVDDGRIYHFNVMDKVLVKRARWSMDGKLHLTSDNQAAGFPAEVFSADRVHELSVGGRIMFTGHAPMPVR